MTLKRIAASMLVGALALAIVASASSAAPGPYDQPPTLSLKKSNIRVKLKRTAVIGTQKCGTGTCTLTVRSFGAVRNSARFKASVIAPKTLASGQSAPIRVRLAPRTFRAIKNAKNGHGHAKVKATLTSSVGYTVRATGKVKFQARKRKKK